MSQAAYFPHRTTGLEREQAEVARRQNQEDWVLLRRFLRWALEDHSQAMCAWAEAAVGQACSETYVRGWEQVLEAWRAGNAEPEDPATWFPWLVSAWDRSQRT